ncbi:MAG: ankyrin repeat domain-containing protein [Acidobacteriota bacterium]
MIRPKSLESERPYGPWSCRGVDIWETICAARDGDVASLRQLLERDPNLYRAEYWYTQPIHFAVREGHLDAVQLLLAAGADPDWHGLQADPLTTVARDRGHEAVARLLESADRAAPAEEAETPAVPESPIHVAAAAGDTEKINELLDADASQRHTTDSDSRTPLSRAVAAQQREIVALLLERGADPNWPEGAEAPQGRALYVASRAGDRALVELLLAHGADPNATIDSAGSATFAAATPEMRDLLIAKGGTLDPYDLIFLGEDEAALRRVEADLACAQAGCGGALAAACTLGKRDLVVRLLRLGVRLPEMVTECRTYLWCDPDLLCLLLDSGMDPDLPDWQHATPLHSLCECDYRGRPRPHRVQCAEILLDAGASITARDEDYQSTPLAWAARSGQVEMVDLLLAKGAPTELADDESWATPLAWARRRGHEAIVERLQ